MTADVTVIIINYQTPDLLRTAVESFRSFYPSVKMTIIDNGSGDSSKEVISTLVRQDPAVLSSYFFDTNVFHGPAMHKGMQLATTKYVFFLDSDTRTVRGDFLDQMIDKMDSSKNMYAVGRIDMVNKRGFITDRHNIVTVRTAYFLIRKSLYAHCRPFEHHGLPTLKNFTDANKLELEFFNFSIQDYVEHLGRGTAGKFGYHLGLKSKIDFALNKLGL